METTTHYKLKNHPQNSLILSLQILLFSLSTLLSPSSSAQQCNPSDKNALLQIQAHFGPYDDTAFPLWGQDPDCCNWFGIQCDSSTGRVTSLFINSSPNKSLTLPTAIGDLVSLQSLQLDFYEKLAGPIPPSFSRLTKLQYLDLSFLGLTGPIPSFLGRFTALNYLDLNTNNFVGSIPSNLGQLTRLTHLDISLCKLTGPIPESIGQLTQLGHLDLSSNSLSGPIPASLSHLTQVNLFDLRGNRLTGSVPASFGSFNNPNTSLLLASNRLSGPLPRSFGNANVSLLDLSANKLTGDASFLFGRDKTALDIIYLGNNRFKFDFSNVVFPIGLRNLNIANNQIYGSLPKQLGQLPLEFLNVRNNQLCGVIPTGRRLKRFTPDWFSHNKCLCGVPLPPCK